MSTEDEIKDAEAAVREAKEALNMATGLLNDLYRRRSKEIYGIEPGMRVRARGGEYLVRSVRPESWVASKPWLRAYKIKKDGTPSEREQTLFGDWEIVGG